MGLFGGGGSKSSTTYTTLNEDASNTLSDSNLNQLESGAILDNSVNEGIQIGPGGTYNVASMDNNTRDILAGSLALVSNNANNMMTLASGDGTKAIAYDVAPVVPEKSTLAQVADLTPSRLWSIAAAVLILFALILNAARKRGSKQ